ncbi:phiSA1p31-related protein [Streptomyces niveus]|uniref:phiSA1p31-related protein n=1 Tax=Streptomyces niveus TaxID=193462 RepID=UPI003864A172
MATAQYETRSRTVEETVVVLTLTEDEADELREIVGNADGSLALERVYRALASPAAPEADAEASTDTYEYDGVTYDLSARYRDCEGDEWTFTGQRNIVGHPCVTMYEGSDNTADTIVSIARGYGPLTEVTP